MFLNCPKTDPTQYLVSFVRNALTEEKKHHAKRRYAESLKIFFKTQEEIRENSHFQLIQPFTAILAIFSHSSYLQPFTAISSHFRSFQPFSAIPAIFSHLKPFKAIPAFSSHFQPFQPFPASSSYFRPFPAIPASCRGSLKNMGNLANRIIYRDGPIRD